MINGVPLEVKEITYLDFPRDKELLAKYKDSIAKYGEKARRVLDRYSLSERGELLGSSPIMNVQLGNLVRLATPQELESAVRQNPDFFRGTYEDIALILGGAGDSYLPNDTIAKNLAKQVKQRLGKMPTSKEPARISLKGLGLKEDRSSDYGLFFVLGEGAEVIFVPELFYENNGKRFAVTDERGVPIWDESGNRRFYTRENGLSRLYLFGDLYLWSGGVNLVDSYSGGRVLVVSGEATSQKFLEDYLANLQKARDVQIAEIQNKYAQAKQVLKGR